MRRLFRVLARVWHRHNIALLSEAIAQERLQQKEAPRRILAWSQMQAEHQAELALLQGRRSRMSPWLGGRRA